MDVVQAMTTSRNRCPLVGTKMRFLSVFGVHLCPSLRYLLRHHADLLFLQTCCSYTMLVGIDGGTEANRYQVSASFQAAHVEHLITALGRHVALGRSASNARMPRFGPIELPAMRNSHVLDAGGTFSMLEIIDIATKGSFLVGNHNQNHGQNREFGRRCLVCIKIGKQLRIPGVSFLRSIEALAYSVDTRRDAIGIPVNLGTKRWGHKTCVPGVAGLLRVLQRGRQIHSRHCRPDSSTYK